MNFEIIVINNHSPIPVPSQIKRVKRIKLITNLENKGYGSGLNQGAKIAKGKYLLLANPDTLFIDKAIMQMVNKMQKDPAIGILGPQILDINNQIQIVGNGMPFLPQATFAFTFLNKLFPKNKMSANYYLPEFDRRNEKEIPVICGACMMISKSLFEKIGGFDEQFFMYFEESDLCFRIGRAGKKILYYPTAKVIHLSGRSTKDKKFIRKVFEESRYKFFKKYHRSFNALLAESFIRFLNR